MAKSFPKLCKSCGRSYDRASWNKLECIGLQEDDVESIELRNCSCGSTLAVLVDPVTKMAFEGRDPTSYESRMSIKWKFAIWGVGQPEAHKKFRSLDEAKAAWAGWKYKDAVELVILDKAGHVTYVIDSKAESFSSFGNPGLPSKNKIEKLVRLWAIKRAAENTGALIKVQQKTYNRFMDLYHEIETNYPNVDLHADSFWDGLERRARDWQRTRAASGPGVDW